MLFARDNKPEESWLKPTMLLLSMSPGSMILLRPTARWWPMIICTPNEHLSSHSFLCSSPFMHNIRYIFNEIAQIERNSKQTNMADRNLGERLCSLFSRAHSTVNIDHLQWYHIQPWSSRITNIATKCSQTIEEESFAHFVWLAAALTILVWGKVWRECTKNFPF